MQFVLLFSVVTKPRNLKKICLFIPILNLYLSVLDIRWIWPVYERISVTDQSTRFYMDMDPRIHLSERVDSDQSTYIRLWIFNLLPVMNNLKLTRVSKETVK